MAGRRIKTGTPAVDRSLEDVWRRLDALERLAGSPEAIAQTLVNNTTVLQTINEGVQSAAYAFGTNTLTTGAGSRWFTAPGFTAATSLVNSGYYSVPAGMTRATGISLAVFQAGGPSTAILTYVVTVGNGNPASETDTLLKMTSPATFVGTQNVSISVPVTPGQALRIRVDRSANLTVAAAGIVAYVQLSAA